MKTVVLGTGGWGTALSLVLCDNGHETVLWSHNSAKAAEMAKTRENPLLRGVILPEKLQITGDLDCLEGADLVVSAPPSFAVRETARKMAPYLTERTVVVSVSKGIERDTNLRLSQVIQEETGNRCPVAALSGPSHAEEVGRGAPTTITVASREREAAEEVQDLLMNPALRLYVNDDVTGVELGGALKNVIALAAGIADGLQLGDNAKAALMTRGITEIARLGVAMGAKTETFAGLSGIGDLIVTCTSMHSRNRRAGILIGQGKSAEEAVREVGTVEGYPCAKTAYELGQKLRVEMPIVEQAYGVLYQKKPPAQALRDLMTRPKRHESEVIWLLGR